MQGDMMTCVRLARQPLSGMLHSAGQPPFQFTAAQVSVERPPAVPKVAHITTVALSLRHLLLNQMLDLQAAGYDVTCISAPGPEVAEIEARGLRHLAVPFRRSSSLTPIQDLRAFVALYRIMRREKFSIVHTHTAKPDLFGQMAARLAGVPIVLSTLHGFYFHEHMPAHWRRFYILLARIGASCSDVILSQNSEDMHTARVENMAPDKLRFLGNGIDLTSFDPHRVDRRAVRAAAGELGLRPGQPVVGFVGRLVRDKGLLELFEATRRVVRHLPQTRLLVVGPEDPDKVDRLAVDAAAAAGVADACVFAGYRSDMPVLYALMDVLVLPSHREAFPRAPMEAGAMGVPCVVTDVRGCREVVEHGRNGLIVPLGSARELAQAILAVLRDRRLAERLGAEGRRVARQRFDERQVFDIIKAEYARLLLDKALPTPQPAPGLTPAGGGGR
jgi:glycosyltransferase involved in cell wall biosynthesis